MFFKYRKLFVLWFVLVLLVSAASVIHAQDEENEDVTLVVWADNRCLVDLDDTWEFCYFMRMIDELWAAEHPNINIQWEEHGWDIDLRNNLYEAIEAGNPPDITVGESFMPELVNDGLLLPAPESVTDNLIPATVAAVTEDDTVYGVSLFTGVFTFEINADLFLISGINPDTVDLSTWGAVEEAAAQITEAGNGNYYGYSMLGPTNLPTAAMFRIAPYLYQNGADFCDMPDCAVPTFDDPNAIAVYEWIRSMYQYTSPDIVFNGDEGFVFSQLFFGQTAMQTAGSWHPTWAAGNGCEGCRYLPLPLPENGERANIVVGNGIYAILESTEHPEEAQMFLEWLASDTVQNAVFWTGVGGRLPTTYSAMESLTTYDTTYIPSFYTENLGGDLDEVPEIVQIYEPFLDELLNGDVRTLPPWQTKPNEMNQLWNELFEDVLRTDIPIPDLLAAYQDEAEIIMLAD